MMKMRRIQGVFSSLLLISLFWGSPAFAMMDERLFMKTVLLEAERSFDEQVIAPNTVYVVQDDFDLGAKSVTLPEGCFLSFQGGTLSNGTLDAKGARIETPADTVLFGQGFLLKDVSNEEVNLAWFTPEENNDLAPLLQGLALNPNVRTLRLAGRRFRTTYVDLKHSLSVVGEGALINPIEKTENAFQGIFRCQEGEGLCSFSFSGFSVIGRKRLTLNSSIIGDPLFYLNNCAQVSFEKVTIGNITGGYGNPEYGYDFPAGLIACFDVKDLSIRNCEFYGNYRFEWICSMPVSLSRSEVNVVFDDNYIHNSPVGATPVTFICNNLSISHNKVRDCKYNGSLFNGYGYHSVFEGNDIRDCVYSSIFDTCEYGTLLKTKRGDVAYYSDTVECVDNYCDCANAALLVTWAREITVRNNVFSGICLCAAQGCKNLGEKPDPDFLLPTNMEISIVNNECNGDKVDRNFTLAYYLNFVRITNAYGMGGNVSIEGNSFLRSSLNEDFPFIINNVKQVVVRNNKIQGGFQYEPKSDRRGITQVRSSFSIYHPLKDLDMDSFSFEENTVLDVPADKVDPVVHSVQAGRPFEIKKKNIRNNAFGDKQ